MSFNGPSSDVVCIESDDDLDYAIALSLQEQINTEPQSSKPVSFPTLKSSKKPVSASEPVGIVDPQWELIDPNPDIHALFLQFNDRFFWGKLDGIEVRWSPRMTTCAGICCYEGRGGLCSVRLSLPLLKLRPRKDLVETLLHEMIHAYLFVTENNKDRDGHGPEFLKHMHRINNETGSKISVFHTFHDEVRLYKQHWWRCTGPCKSRGPFYGMVKRAMNRSPGPNDIWWSQHQATCDGVFEKIKEPDNYKSAKRKAPSESTTKKGDISNFFNPQNGTSSKIQKKNPPTQEPSSQQTVNGIKLGSSGSKETDLIESIPVKNYPTPFTGNGIKLGTSGSSSKKKPPTQKPVSQETVNGTKLGSSGSSESEHIETLPVKNYPTPFTGNGIKLGSSGSSSKSLLSRIRQEIGVPPPEGVRRQAVPGGWDDTDFRLPSTSQTSNSAKPSRLIQSSLDKFVSPPKELKKRSNFVTCPICSNMCPEDTINQHLDSCIQKNA